MMICSRPPFDSFSRRQRERAPLRGRSQNRSYARRAWIMQPVGKSGPLMDCIKPSSAMSGSSICAQMPSMISPQIVRRNIRRHPDGNAGAAVDQQVGKRRREDGRSRSAAHRSSGRNRRSPCPCHPSACRPRCEARFGVPHGRRRIAFDRTEISLPIARASRASPKAAPCARASDKYRLAVRMIIAHRVAADLRALQMLSRRIETQLVHRVEDAALRGFQPIARIRQRA